MSKKRVQEQFGANAAAYATSKVHASGASLTRLVDLVQPQLNWQVLDVATGAGHTAVTLAPYVSHVVATDITPEMLFVAARLVRERNVTNITLETADAENLPFDDDSFDLVTCRIAAHHFPNIGRFMAESARVLHAGGILAIVDNIVPGSHLRGKKAKRLRLAGEYVNTFEKLRDPSHGRCLSLDRWIERFRIVNFTNRSCPLYASFLRNNAKCTSMRTTIDDRYRGRHQIPLLLKWQNNFVILQSVP